MIIFGTLFFFCFLFKSVLLLISSDIANCFMSGNVSFDPRDIQLVDDVTEEKCHMTGR